MRMALFFSLPFMPPPLLCPDECADRNHAGAQVRNQNLPGAVDRRRAAKGGGSTHAIESRHARFAQEAASRAGRHAVRSPSPEQANPISRGTAGGRPAAKYAI